MKLVFVLMLQTLNSAGYVTDTEQMGYWADVTDCVWFAEVLSLQGRGKYDIPIRAYCEPTFVDPTVTEIF